MALKTRQPTGTVAYPVIVIEGGEKAGKTYEALRLSASDKVGRTFVFDLGEGSADEYAALGPYEVVDHDGTFTDLLAKIRLATKEPSVDGKPNVIVIDSATVVWEAIKAWADQRARRGKKARAILASDPDADVPIPMNIWTDAGDRWGQMMHALRYWDGIGILICRGKEVAKVDSSGQPVTGQSDYKVEAHKSTLYQTSAHVRMEAPKRARLMSVRSLHADVPRGGELLPEANPLEHVVFGVLGAGGSFGTSSAVAPTIEGVIPTELVERVRAACSTDELRAAFVQHFGAKPAEVPADRTSDVEDWIYDLEAVSDEQIDPPTEDQ